MKATHQNTINLKTSRKRKTRRKIMLDCNEYIRTHVVDMNMK